MKKDLKKILDHSKISEWSKKVITDYIPENTKRSIDISVKYFIGWCEAVGIKLEEMSFKKNIIAFISHHVEEMPKIVEDELIKKGIKKNLYQWKFSTMMTKLYNLKTYLKQWNIELPLNDVEISTLLKRLRRKNITLSKRQAILKEMLLDMIDTCSDDKIIDLRDKALLLFGFCSGGRRRSEISSAKIENIKMMGNECMYKIEKSKTDQEGKGMFVPIKGKAFECINKWLKTLNQRKGPLFRSIRKNGSISSLGLTPQEINRIVKKRAKMAGYDEKFFSAHSLRYGFVTEGGRRNINIRDIMDMTGHKSLTIAMNYYKSASNLNNPAADLF